jgi:MFS family permease
MILPTGQTILAREAGPHRLGRVMTVVGVPQFLAPLLGPVAGGLVLSTVSWRWIFFINLPIGIIALIRGRRILEPGELGTPERIDFLGMALLSPGFALLIYGIAEFGNVGEITILVSSTFLGGLLLLGLFAMHALRVEHPLLDLRPRCSSSSAQDCRPPSSRYSSTTR